MPETLKNDEQLKKVLAEVTPQVLVDAIDELLLLQRGKELGYTLSDEQFKDWRRRTSARSRTSRTSEVPGGAEAGRHDDGRSAQELERQMHRSSRCSARRSARS